MKIDKIISASLVATLSCGFAGAFSVHAAYTEDQAIERFNEVKSKYGIANLEGDVVLSLLEVDLGVDYNGLLNFIDDNGNLLTQKMTVEQKKRLKDSLAANGYTVTKGSEEGTYDIYKKDGTGISANDLKTELATLKNTSTDSNNNNNTGSGFVISGGSSGSTSTSSSSTSTSTGSTNSNTKVDYGSVGEKNKIVQDSGVYKFASEKAGVTRLQEGQTRAVFKSTIEDAQAKGMSLVTIALEGTGKDDDTKTVWAFDVEKVNKSEIDKPFEAKVVVSEGKDIANKQSETNPNLLSAAKISAVQDGGRATDTGAAAELKTDINKKGTKVVDFGKADGDALPCAAAVRVNIADTDKKIKIKVYYICNSRCYKLGIFETDSKGNVICNLPAESQIGDFVFVPAE